MAGGAASTGMKSIGGDGRSSETSTPGPVPFEGAPPFNGIVRQPGLSESSVVICLNRRGEMNA